MEQANGEVRFSGERFIIRVDIGLSILTCKTKHPPIMLQVLALGQTTTSL
jgi:hypothetical protein